MEKRKLLGPTTKLSWQLWKLVVGAPIWRSTRPLWATREGVLGRQAHYLEFLCFFMFVIFQFVFIFHVRYLLKSTY
jgi:hypothetical protein